MISVRLLELPYSRRASKKSYHIERSITDTNRGTAAAWETIIEIDMILRDQPMATHQSKPQKETISRVMHEFKHGELETGSRRKVRNPRQAIAIGLREAGASRYESKEKNRENLRRTKARERRGATEKDRSEGQNQTRAELYAEARRRKIPGRSKMSKTELERALH